MRIFRISQSYIEWVKYRDPTDCQSGATFGKLLVCKGFEAATQKSFVSNANRADLGDVFCFVLFECLIAL